MEEPWEMLVYLYNTHLFYATQYKLVVLKPFLKQNR